MGNKNQEPVSSDGLTEEQVTDLLVVESIRIQGKECTPRVMRTTDWLLDQLNELRPPTQPETEAATESESE